MSLRLIKRKSLLFALLISTITLFILIKISSLELNMIPQAFSQLGIKGLLILPLLLGCSFTADALRLKIMAWSKGKRLPFKTALLCALGGIFLTNVSPFYLGAGLFYSVIFMLKGISWPAAVSLIIAGSFFNHMVHFGLGLLILLICPNLPTTFSHTRWYLLIIYLSISLLFLLTFSFKEKVVPLLQNRGPLGRILLQGLDGFTSIWGLDKKYMLLLLSASTTYFFTFYGIATYILYTIVPDSPYLLAYPLQLLSYLISLPLPTPGATGGVELAALTSFSLIAPLLQVGQVVILWRLFIYYIPLLIGGPALLMLSKKEGIKREDFNRDLFTIKDEIESEVIKDGSSTSIPTPLSWLWKRNPRRGDNPLL